MAWSGGQRLQDGKYTIERELGLGGFGITYGARDDNKHDFVVKTLNDTVQKRPDFAKFQQDFLNEALRLAKCSHPHIVRIDEVIQEGPLWCIVMEYIAGVNLATQIENMGSLPEAEALQYIQQIGEALTVVHKNGLLHRDIKPQNIMLRSGNNNAVLIDFGIARQFTPDLTQRHTEHLTPGFAPIEQYFNQRKRGAYTDVYALAATLYALLTGITPPCALDRDDEIQNFRNDPLVPPNQVNMRISDKVNQAVLTGMEIEPENRPQSIQDWLALLPLNNDTPSILSKMVGTWLGNFGARNKPATLIITQQSGDLFDGTLIVQDSKVDWNYRINIKGYHNSETNKIAIQEHRVLSEPWWCNWRRGENEGTLSLDEKKMSGNGKDSRDSYSWSFLKVDYTDLTNLLERGKWKEADQETGTLMLKISCSEQRRLNSKDIENFPCQDLCTIDQLWVNYSKGRFGFSVQRRIWENVNCDWKKCGERVGWCVNNDWKNYHELTFTLNASEGAFPTFWGGGVGRNLVFGYPGCWQDFFSRVKACGL